MTKPLFLLQSHKFSNDNIETTLVCPKCDEVFKKEFPIDLEGQITEFKCPVCDNSGEADLLYKGIEERELSQFDPISGLVRSIQQSKQTSASI